MNHKRIVEWLSQHRTEIIWGASISVVLVTLIIIIGNLIVQSTVVSRTKLYELENAGLSIEIFQAPLSGMLADKLDASRPVVGVMIENSPEARPQSGLAEAEVVFEAIAEGGITRFVAFFQASQPAKVGPIRSLRPYYSDWVLSFDASIAHVGGSPTALAEVRSLGIKDLDQFANGSYYYRDSARYAPHNVYSSLEQLTALAVAKGYTSSVFEGWTFKDPLAIETPKAVSITLNISSYTFQAQFDYDAATNKYLRSEAGQPHLDANGQRQIAVDNLVVMKVPYSILSDGHYSYALVGSGQATIFRDGDQIETTWSRASRNSPFIFKSADNVVELNRGRTWVTAISPSQPIVVGGGGITP